MEDVEESDLSRAEFVYKWVLESIHSGHLKPGQRLREAELATRLKVSRTPIREAMRRLNADGLAQMALSRGMVVTQFDKQQVRELYALRETLEGAAAGLAAQHASADEIADMRQLVERTRSRARSAAREDARTNRLFHQAICEAAHNRYLAQALERFSHFLALLPGTTFEVPGRAEAARKEHLAILAAIEQRRSAKAEEAARDHIRAAGSVRMRMMFEML